MKPLAGTSFQHIRDAIELGALGALRLIEDFPRRWPSRTGRSSTSTPWCCDTRRRRSSAYPMAKSALLAMSQSLATELGEQGIRVNSVAPGYIWGETLQSYSSIRRVSTAPGRPGLSGHRGELRPQAAADGRRSGVGDHVFCQRPVQRYHRSDPGSRLRGVPQLMAERTIWRPSTGSPSATKLTGLDDFGVDDDNYREALGVLLDSYRREAGLTVLGSKMNWFFSRRWWRGCSPNPRGSSTRSTPTSQSSGPSSSPGWCGPAPRRCIGCLAPTPLLRVCTCGWRSSRSPVRPARPGNLIRCIASSTRNSPSTTGQPRLHGPAFHGRVRAGGMLAVVASVTAFGFLRDAGAPAQLLGVVGATGLDAGISPHARTFS